MINFGLTAQKINKPIKFILIKEHVNKIEQKIYIYNKTFISKFFILMVRGDIVYLFK